MTPLTCLLDATSAGENHYRPHDKEDTAMKEEIKDNALNDEELNKAAGGKNADTDREKEKQTHE